MNSASVSRAARQAGSSFLTKKSIGWLSSSLIHFSLASLTGAGGGPKEP